MDQLDDALTYYRHALDVGADNAASDPTSMEAQQFLASAHSRLGVLYAGLNDNAEALSEFRQSLAIWENIADKEPSFAHLKSYAGALRRIGSFLSKQSDFPDAIRNYEAA
jgi:tetratricopeptide (TPR) repeat protein